MQDETTKRKWEPVVRRASGNVRKAKGPERRVLLGVERASERR
jgi:hypothetical protein